MGLRGMTEDRLATLGEEYGTKYVVPGVREAGRRLLDEARKRGRRVVLVSDSLDVVIAPLADALSVPREDVVANALELSSARVVTGRLREPIVGASSGWAKSFAADRGIDLTKSVAYGSHGDDALLLAGVGEACCIAPDRALRRVARDSGWPVVEA
jgi:phosphoserine phosphatase